MSIARNKRATGPDTVAGQATPAVSFYQFTDHLEDVGAVCLHAESEDRRGSIETGFGPPLKQGVAGGSDQTNAAR